MNVIYTNEEGVKLVHVPVVTSKNIHLKISWDTSSLTRSLTSHEMWTLIEALSQPVPTGEVTDNEQLITLTNTDRSIRVRNRTLTVEIIYSNPWFKGRPFIIPRSDLPQVRRALSGLVSGNHRDENTIFQDAYTRRLTAEITPAGTVRLRMYGSPEDRSPISSNLYPDEVRTLTRTLMEMKDSIPAPRMGAGTGGFYLFRAAARSRTVIRADGSSAGHQRRITVPDLLCPTVCVLLNDYADVAAGKTKPPVQALAEPSRPVLDVIKIQEQVNKAADALQDLVNVLRDSPAASSGTSRAEPTPEGDSDTFVGPDECQNLLARQFVFLGMPGKKAEAYAKWFLRRHRENLAAKIDEAFSNITEYPPSYRVGIIEWLLTGKNDKP